MTPKNPRTPPKVKTPRRGKPWPAKVVKQGLVRLRETLNATAAKKLLETEDFSFEPRGPGRSTLIGWARREGLALTNVDPGKARATGSATAERVAKMAEARSEFGEVLLERLSRPAAALIAARLENAVEVEGLVKVATDRYREALIFASQVRGFYADTDKADLDAEAVQAAKAAQATALAEIKEARADLRLALEVSMDTRDLVGIVTRSVNDHLALEGLAVSEKGGGDLIVELSIPRPDRKAQDEAAIPEDELAKRREGAA